MTHNDRNEIMKRLKAKIAELVDSPELAERLDVHGSIQEAGVDSILTINLLVYIEEAFDVTFRDEELDIDHFATVSQIADCITGKKAVGAR
jgi:acyl carrier protein